MTLKRVTKSDAKFHCDSCSKNIIDFRKLDNNQILEILKTNSNACGIFNSQQISTPKRKWSYHLKYAILTLIACFGMNVKPIQAQLVQSDSTQSIENKKVSVKEIKEEKKKTSLKKKRRTTLFRRKYRLMGCPDF